MAGCGINSITHAIVESSEVAIHFFRSDRLDRVVRSIWGVEADGRHDTLPGLIAPDGHVEFVFHAGSPWRMKSVLASDWILQPAAFVYAQQRGCLQLEETAQGSFVAFRVSPVTAAAILRQPLTELWDQVIALEDLIGPEAQTFAEQLAEANMADRFSLLQSWIEKRLRDWDTEQRELQSLFETMFWRCPAGTLSELSASLGPSVRSLRRWFASTAGVSPKEIQIAGRMLLACSLLRKRPDFDIASIAQDTDFYDHAAFTHTFTERVGLTPSRFRSEPSVYYERARATEGRSTARVRLRR
jgi:AraC-like DNA-binding protein